MKSIIIILSFLLLSLWAQAQNDINTAPEQQEIVLVGTMHYVPNLVKRAYKPMLRKAKKLNPDAIFLEYVPSHDSASIAFDTPDFLKWSDSINNVFQADQIMVDEILDKELKAMKTEDYAYMKKVFIANRDYANYRYYEYLENYGVQGAGKPLQNETGDVSFPLAIEQNIKIVHSMDYQSSNEHYYKYWRACDSVSTVDGESKRINKIAKNLYLQDVVGTLVYGLSRQTNKEKTTVAYHKMNAFEMREEENELCTLGGYWWGFRNARMAQNIGEQVIDQDINKSIVVVGAGHIVGIEKELRSQFPQLKITKLYK